MKWIYLFAALASLFTAVRLLVAAGESGRRPLLVLATLLALCWAGWRSLR
jgi:hypothetical protein